MKNIILLLIILFYVSCKHEKTERVQVLDGEWLEIRYPEAENDSNRIVGYYPSGGVYERKFMIRVPGMKFIECYWYYEDGPIAKYKFYWGNHLQYYADYSKEGTIIKTKGQPVVTDSINQFEADSTSRFLRRVVLVRPPNCKVGIMVCNWVPDSLEEDPETDECFTYQPIDTSVINYHYKFTTPASLKKQIYYLAEDSANGFEERYRFIDEWTIK